MKETKLTKEHVLEVMTKLAVDGIVCMPKAELAKEHFNHRGVNPTAYITKYLDKLIKDGVIERTVVSGLRGWKIIKNYSNTSTTQKDAVKEITINNTKVVESKNPYDIRVIQTDDGMIIPVSDIAKELNTVAYKINNTLNRATEIKPHIVKQQLDGIRASNCLTVEGAKILLNIVSKKYNDLKAMPLYGYINTLNAKNKNSVATSNVLTKDTNDNKNSVKEKATTSDVIENIEKISTPKGIVLNSIENHNKTEDDELNFNEIASDSDELLNGLYESFGGLREIIKNQEEKMADYQKQIEKLQNALLIEKAKYNKVIDNVARLKNLVEDEIKSKVNLSLG